MAESNAAPVVVGQAVIVAQPQQELTVTVPAGVAQGQQFQVQTPSGQMVMVVVPPGAAPGSQIKIQVPAAQQVQPAMMMAGPGTNPPPGAPPGGQWVQESYIGIITIILAVFVAICALCCPCDTRMVYVAPNGVKYKANGAIAHDCDTSP